MKTSTLLLSLLLLSLLLCALACRAQDSAHFPSEAAVGAALPRIEAERKALFDPANPATSAAGANFPQIATPAPAGLDPQTLAAYYAQSVARPDTGLLMVFVSFGMPAASLQRLLAQAGALGGVLVLNGFKDNSLRETARAVQALGAAAGAVQIDPNAFARYRIRAVPVVLLARAGAGATMDAQGCALPEDYAAVAGDVSLDYALQAIGDGDPRFAAQARDYLRRLGGRP